MRGRFGENRGALVGGRGGRLRGSGQRMNGFVAPCAHGGRGGGIFGRITALDEERGFVILQISDNTKVKVLRGAISGLAGEPEATSNTAAT